MSSVMQFHPHSCFISQVAFKNSHLCLFCLLEEHFESNLILKQNNGNSILNPLSYIKVHTQYTSSLVSSFPKAQRLPLK